MMSQTYSNSALFSDTTLQVGIQLETTSIGVLRLAERAEETYKEG